MDNNKCDIFDDGDIYERLQHAFTSPPNITYISWTNLLFSFPYIWIFCALHVIIVRFSIVILLNIMILYA